MSTRPRLVSWARRQGDLEAAGDLFEASVAVDQEREDFPFVFVREVGVFDQLDPAAFDFAQARAEDFEPAALKEQVAATFHDACAGEVRELRPRDRLATPGRLVLR